MYVVVQHEVINPTDAFARGEALVNNTGAPEGVRGLQFYPSRDGSAITCLWEAGSVESVQGYVDATLGDSCVNSCYPVDAEQAFADHPAELQPAPARVAG